MKNRHFAAAFVLISAVGIAAPAMASYSSGNVYQDVRSAAGSSGQINIEVDGNTATLFGYSERLNSLAAERAALNAPGIDKVVNNIIES